MIVGGVLSPIENVLTAILEWFHSSVGFSWAWSIVALTVAVRFLLVPVVVRQIHSMQSLQAHAPEMKALQAKYKHDRQRQNEELMKFYRENNINPAASCLPIVLQIPIFIGLFFVLRDFEKEIFTPKYDEPASALDWLGLVDITADVKDGWGSLLLVVYVVSQLSSSYFMSTTMQRAQRILLMVLPIVFVPFILQFPAGLMIYWMTTNLWTTGQGLVTRKMIPKPALPEKRTSRSPSKDPPPEPPGKRGPRSVPSSSPGDGRQTAGPPRRVKRKRGGSRRR